MGLSDFPFAPFFLSLYLGSSGVRKGSLSPSGGLAAFVVGFAIMSVKLRVFGVSLIVFYLVGSRATKVGDARKTRYEEGHQKAGNRSAMQVLCNSLAALVAAVLWSAMFVPGSFAAGALGSFVRPRVPYELDVWCPLSPAVAGGWSRVLLFVTLGHFACCLGDTLASELGILSSSPPRLITTLRTVPPGTNGAVSLNGLLCSAGGGMLIGLTLFADLYLESAACRAEWRPMLVAMGKWGSFAGLFGSLVDSLLGATVQATKYDWKTKRVLTDESGVPRDDTMVKTISGFDALSNNQVNLVSSVITAVLLGALAAQNATSDA